MKGSNYPIRKNYKSNWGYQMDLRKWRKQNRESIARLRYAEPLEAVDFGRN